MDTMIKRAPQHGAPLIDSVPEWSPRSAAGLSSLLLASVVFGAPPALLILLVPDFLARTINRRRWTYLAVLAGPFGRRLLSRGSLARRSRWAPKRFASALGLTMLGMILSAFVAGYAETATLLCATMTVLTALEALFGICVACQIYTHVLGPLGLVEACPDGSCSL
jgi:Domain of unknown function (DUF4395)